MVDDNRGGAEALALFLQMLGIEFKVVHEEPAALEAVSVFEPTVVLWHLRMAGMDGYATARRIRQFCDGQNLKLIAMTGWGQEQDRRCSAEAGFNHHLVKLVDPDELEAVLVRS